MVVINEEVASIRNKESKFAKGIGKTITLPQKLFPLFTSWIFLFFKYLANIFKKLSLMRQVTLKSNEKSSNHAENPSK